MRKCSADVHIRVILSTNRIRNAKSSIEKEIRERSWGCRERRDIGVFFGQSKVRLWLPDELVAELRTLG